MLGYLKVLMLLGVILDTTNALQPCGDGGTCYSASEDCFSMAGDCPEYEQCCGFRRGERTVPGSLWDLD